VSRDRERIYQRGVAAVTQGCRKDTTIIGSLPESLGGGIDRVGEKGARSTLRLLWPNPVP